MSELSNFINAVEQFSLTIDIWIHSIDGLQQ